MNINDQHADLWSVSFEIDGQDGGTVQVRGIDPEAAALHALHRHAANVSSGEALTIKVVRWQQLDLPRGLETAAEADAELAIIRAERVAAGLPVQVHGPDCDCQECRYENASGVPETCPGCKQDDCVCEDYPGQHIGRTS